MPELTVESPAFDVPFRAMSSPKLLFTCAILASTAVSHAQTFAFQSDEHIAVASLADARVKPKKLTKGFDPRISPDGTKVAYTQSDDEGNRRIAIFDLASGKSGLVKDIPGKNEFMGEWSADGKQLLFHHFVETDWSVAAVNAAGGGFRIVIDKGQRHIAGFSHIAGTKDWLGLDMDAFFIATLEGDGLAKIRDLPKTTALEGISAPSRVAVSPDGKHGLFEQLVDGEMKPTDEGPPSAVFLIEIATGKISRVTPKGLSADGPSWLPDGKEILFGSFDSKTHKESIYRIAIAPGSKPVLVLKGGRNPSVAAK